MCGINGAVGVVISHAPFPHQYIRSVAFVAARGAIFFLQPSVAASLFAAVLLYVNGDPENAPRASLTALAGLPLALVVGRLS